MRPPTTFPRTMIRTIRVSKDVGAVASLGNDVFVAFLSNDQNIAVYDAFSLKFKRNLMVPGLGYCSWGLAVCERYKCLYASDWSNDRIHRAQLPDGVQIMTFPVASKPAGLSVNNEHNLLVVSQAERKLQEFTTHGVPMRDIQLPGNDTPWQAVQLPNNNLLLTSFGSSHLVSAISPVSGKCSDSHGGPKGCGRGQFNRPAGLAVDSKGGVLVADWYNNRLVVLDVSNGWINVQSLPSKLASLDDCGLKGPCSLWYDQIYRRLYIGECEWEGHRVVIIDNLQEFSAQQVCCVS